MLADPAAAIPRATDDVDALVHATTYVDYLKVEEGMKSQGFKQDPTSPVIC